MIILNGIVQIVEIETCSYIGANFWNKGRTQEIKERVIHIDNKDDEE